MADLNCGWFRRCNAGKNEFCDYVLLREVLFNPHVASILSVCVNNMVSVSFVE